MIAAATPGYAPYLIAAAIAFAMYRRIRTHFGRQAWRPARVLTRLVLLSLFLAVLAAVVVMKPAEDWGIGVGALAGAALGLLSLRLVRVDVVGGEPGYTPNPWIGALLTGLLVGRIAWRFASGGFAQPPSSGPLTLAIAATVLTFYLVQGIGLMRRMKALTAAPVATA